MNGGPGFARAYIDEFSGHLGRLHGKPDMEIVLAPPAVVLAGMSVMLTALEVDLVSMAAQNVAAYPQGAYTGELSASMLAEVGCSWCIVGHSERRALFGETDHDVVAKVTQLLEASIRPIVCVGETLAQREQGRAETVVSAQVEAVLSAFDSDCLKRVVFAYEPVWAIGTGRTASPEQAQQMHASIRGAVGRKSESLAVAVGILYGGSVNAANAGELFAQPDVDGALVGGASLKPSEFARICEQVG
jgi:triosephosphate isomerase